MDSTTETPVAPVTTPAPEPKAPKAKKGKKTVSKATIAKKTTVKKAAPKATKPKENKTPTPRGELNKPQTFILKALAKKAGAYTRPEIGEMAAKLGCATSRGRISDEAGNYGYLVEKKWVRVSEVGVNGAKDDSKKTVYEITASGKAALAKHGK